MKSPQEMVDEFLANCPAELLGGGNESARLLGGSFFLAGIAMLGQMAFDSFNAAGMGRTALLFGTYAKNAAKLSQEYGLRACEPNDVANKEGPKCGESP